MSDIEKRPSPGRYEENSIVITVPTGTLKQEIENQIHDALAEMPQDIFTGRASREVLIVLQHEGNHEPKKP
jgi:hypothetical protein